MILDSAKLSAYEKSVIAGLYLSKFNSAGLKFLGFSSFKEAFNAIGLALSTKPASIKNYRDEFDPYFPSGRKGWRKREIQADRRVIFESCKEMDLEPLADFLRASVYGGDLDLLREAAEKDEANETESTFAKRLITGLAAENYFKSIHPKLPILQDYRLENVSRMGCGFDFKLSNSGSPEFLAVEVKGLNEPRGTIALTEKEHRVAGLLSDRFFLFVVRNFRETPLHNVYRNPLNSGLSFVRHDKPVIQLSWRMTI